MTYEKTADGGVQRTADKAMIPPDPANRDWQEYLGWHTINGDPVDAALTPLIAAKNRARERAEAKAKAAIAVFIGGPEEYAIHTAAMREVELHESGAVTVEGSLPIMAARKITTLQAIVDATLADDKTMRTSIAAADTARVADLAAIDAATTEAEADALPS